MRAGVGQVLSRPRAGVGSVGRCGAGVGRVSGRCGAGVGQMCNMWRAGVGKESGRCGAGLGQMSGGLGRVSGRPWVGVGQASAGVRRPRAGVGQVLGARAGVGQVSGRCAAGLRQVWGRRRERWQLWGRRTRSSSASQRRWARSDTGEARSSSVSCAGAHRCPWRGRHSTAAEPGSPQGGTSRLRASAPATDQRAPSRDKPCAARAPTSAPHRPCRRGLGAGKEQARERSTTAFPPRPLDRAAGPAPQRRRCACVGHVRLRVGHSPTGPAC